MIRLIPKVYNLLSWHLLGVKCVIYYSHAVKSYVIIALEGTAHPKFLDFFNSFYSIF